MTGVGGPTWRRPPLIPNPWLRRSLAAAAVIYLGVALSTLHPNWSRLAEGAGRGAAFLRGFLHPDFTSRAGDIAEGMIESLAMTAVATAVGLVLALPLAFGAARTVSPRPLYLACRGIVAAARGLHEVVIAILFVVMVGFGPLAGVLTLSVASAGFLGKLLAEAIEGLDRAPIEAVRATGAGRLQVGAWGIVPQLLPRLVGLSVYRLDINFRESAVIGVVGAGGIGATLATAFSRYEFATAAAVLLLIVGIVLAGEIASGQLRKGLL